MKNKKLVLQNRRENVKRILLKGEMRKVRWHYFWFFIGGFWLGTICAVLML